MPRQVILYMGKLCGDCQKLKAFMDAEAIDYELRDIREDPDHVRVLEEKTGKVGVPYLVVDGEWKRGYAVGEPFSKEFARSLFET